MLVMTNTVLNSMSICPHSMLQLFEQYLLMLSSAGVFESRFQTATDMELGQSVMRVLLGAIINPDKEVCIHVSWSSLSLSVYSIM